MKKSTKLVLRLIVTASVSIIGYLGFKKGVQFVEKKLTDPENDFIEKE